MADYPTENRGTLWFNTDKKNDKAPDYNLNVNIMGKDYAIAAWKKTTKEGRKFISFNIEEGDGKRGGSKSSNEGGW
jgi:uncharacterized protein (DUF736 family)